MLGNPDMLTVVVWVEDLYERCIAPNDSHLTLFQMMTCLEQHLEQELVTLDYLKADEVKAARLKVYQDEERQMKVAQDAQRKVVNITSPYPLQMGSFINSKLTLSPEKWDSNIGEKFLRTWSGV